MIYDDNMMIYYYIIMYVEYIYTHIHKYPHITFISSKSRHVIPEVEAGGEVSGETDGLVPEWRKNVETLRGTKA